jgi:hypothetical protein
MEKNEEQIFKMGSKAYLKGKSLEDNPFDKNIESGEYKAWTKGWHDECRWWAKLFTD